MKSLVPPAFFIVLYSCMLQPAFAQSCAECRYVSPVFDSVTVETVKFGQGPRYGGAIQELYMDIYQPFGDTATDRAVAIFAFGGAFITGSRDDWYVVLACEELAKAGYVVASIDYRIYDDLGGMIAEILSDFPPPHMRIFFRPMQDMRAAVQYLKADYSELGNNYKIDTSRILIGGASSGAITSMMTAYCDKDSEMAQMAGGSLDPLIPLGGFYSTTSLYPNYSWKALATYNVSGAMIDADWIEPGDIPIISAHGNADQVVPYKSGGLGGITVGTFDLQGSYVVDSIARAKGVCSYLYTMEGKDHPNEDFGIEYIKSVVYRLMIHMHAVINDRSFCCPLETSVTADDTIRYAPANGEFDVTATLVNDSGNAQIQWCGTPCLVNASSASVTVQPDTALHYITCMAYEGACQSAVLNMVKVDSTVSTGNMVEWPKVGFAVFPQPAADAFMISINDNVIAEKKLKVFDLTGRLVLSKTMEAQVSSAKVDVRKLNAGSYILRLEGDGFEAEEKKLVVVK